MKRIVKNKLLPVAIFAVIGISLLVFLYCKSFRITYAPDLENSWNAVSAFAAWGGVFMSFLAIIAAGIVAWRQNEIMKQQISIADKQNKIALFEKRLEIYDIILSCSVNVDKMKITDKNEDILKNLFILLTEDLLAYQKFNRKEVMLYLANCSTKLQHSVFLFPNKISSYLLDASKALLDLACIDIEADEIEGYNKEIQTYFEVIRCLKENNVLKTIQEEIKMM